MIKLDALCVVGLAEIARTGYKTEWTKLTLTMDWKTETGSF